METTTLANNVRQIALTEDPPLRPIAATRRNWSRLAFLAILAFAAYAFVMMDIIGEALSGSRAVVLLVLPILIGVIITGYRDAPRGVSDAESNWIIAILFGIAGFTGIHLMKQRMPTLSVQWQLDLVGVLLWIACLVTVMFGVRHVVRMWQMWLFAICCVSPLAFLLTAAAFGGSDTVITLLAAVLGAVAVFLAGRNETLGRRLLATLLCAASGSALSAVIGNHLSLSAAVMLVAGVVPVVVTMVMLLRDTHPVSTATNAWADLPRRGTLTLLMLVLVSVTLLLTNPPHAGSNYAGQATADWERRAGLTAEESFPFIKRYVGTDATLVRYSVPASPTMPTAAVDVITTTRPAALEDYDDAIWYPTGSPAEYRPVTGGSMPAGTRVIHSNAAATTDAAAVDWYAVTWMWRTGDNFQRVTVIVNQSVGSTAPPPTPEALSILDTSLKPALWLSRQQANGTGEVEPLVVARADDVIKLLVHAAGVGPKAATSV